MALQYDGEYHMSRRSLCLKVPRILDVTDISNLVTIKIKKMESTKQKHDMMLKILRQSSPSTAY